VPACDGRDVGESRAGEYGHIVVRQEIQKNSFIA